MAPRLTIVGSSRPTGKYQPGRVNKKVIQALYYISMGEREKKLKPNLEGGGVLTEAGQVIFKGAIYSKSRVNGYLCILKDVFQWPQHPPRPHNCGGVV